VNLFHALVATPELQATMSQVQLAIQQRSDADLAVAANGQNIESANAVLPELEREAAELHAQATRTEALVSANRATKADVARAVKAADKAAIDAAEKKREIERATAARDVLAEMARDADSAIKAAKAAFTATLTAFRERLLCAFEEDLLQACAALAPVVLAAKAVDADFPGRLCAPLINDLKITSPRGYRVHHADYGPSRVSGTDLLAVGTPAPSLPEDAALTLRDIRAIVDALNRHQPFTMPKLSQIGATEQRPESPTRSPSEQRRYDEAAERIRRSEEEFDQREHRSKQPQTPEERRKWSLDVREPGTPVPPARGRLGNLSARSHDGDVSEEYARINEWMDDTQIGSGARGEA